MRTIELRLSLRLNLVLPLLLGSIAAVACGGDDGANTRPAVDVTDATETPDAPETSAADTVPEPDDGASDAPPPEPETDASEPETVSPDASLDTGLDAVPDLVDAAPLLATYPIPGSRLYPESVTFDPKRRHFLIGSLDEASVIRIAADGAASYLFEGPGTANLTTLGLKVDAPRDRLVVCAYLNTATPTGRLWVFDLATGQRTHDLDLTTAVAGASCNDLVIDSDGSGAIYVTDRELPNIYRVELDGVTPTVALWASDPKLAKVLVGQNGIAFSPDGRWIITGHYLPPKLHRIARADPSSVHEIPLTGSHPLSQLFSGADGIAFFEGALYVAFGSALVKVDPSDADWTAATYLALEVGVPIAALTPAEGALYLLQSDVAAFVLSGRPAREFAIFRVDPAALAPLP